VAPPRRKRKGAKTCVRRRVVKRKTVTVAVAGPGSMAIGKLRAGRYVLRLALVSGGRAYTLPILVRR
jgi:hypothetical protein